MSLDYITETTDEILIGAETSLRTLEINEIIRNYCSGAISEGVSNIVNYSLEIWLRLDKRIFLDMGFPIYYHPYWF